MYLRQDDFELLLKSRMAATASRLIRRLWTAGFAVLVVSIAPEGLTGVVGTTAWSAIARAPKKVSKEVSNTAPGGATDGTASVSVGAGGGPSAASASVPSTEKFELVTRVVGEAGPRVVTSREVSINEAIGQVLGGAPEKNREELILDSSHSGFPAQVVRVLDEWTVYLEAAEIDAKSVEKSEVAGRVKKVQDFWKGSPHWEKLEASGTEIREIVERKLTAKAFEKIKLDASLVNISDAEALQYYKKNRLRFGNMPFESFKDNIKTALAKGQTERRLLEWHSILRRKYRVRNYLGA